MGLTRDTIINMRCPGCGGRLRFYPGDPGRLYGLPETCYPPELCELECQDGCDYEFTDTDCVDAEEDWRDLIQPEFDKYD